MEDDKKEYPHSEETGRIIGCAMEVLNELGHGYVEKIYENALGVEFRVQAIPFSQQGRFNVIYKGVEVGEYIPDLIAYDKVVVDAKVIGKITDNEIGQMMNYLKTTGYKVGLILNFKRARLEFKRVVL